jgi:succinyl-CoA synthetase beta subunit
MARFFEYQGKKFLKDTGIAIPNGEVASTAKEAYEAAARIGKSDCRRCFDSCSLGLQAG